MKKKKLFLILVFLVLMLIVINLFYFSIMNFSQKDAKLNMEKEIYVMSYVGDIDGDVSEDWFFFFEKLLDFHNENKIPTTFSFYPASIKDNGEFNRIFAKMYKSEYIDLMQKGWKGDEIEMRMETLSFEQQREIIQSGQDYFKEKMQKILNQKNIELPISYNQIGGKFNSDTMKAAESVGFKIYFDMYVGDNVAVLNSSKTFDVGQYGEGFTKFGKAGRDTKFFAPEEMLSHIDNFDRQDVPILIIDGKKVISIWCHQQDFEDKKIDFKLDEEKWEIYTETLKTLNKDPNVIFITAKDVYKLRH